MYSRIFNHELDATPFPTSLPVFFFWLRKLSAKLAFLAPRFFSLSYLTLYQFRVLCVMLFFPCGKRQLTGITRSL